jgi:hypothetical protein
LLVFNARNPPPDIPAISKSTLVRRLAGRHNDLN